MEQLNKDSSPANNIRNEIFIFAIFAYFTGWTYAFFYFDYFGISVFSLTIPFYYFFVFAYTVAITKVKILIFIAAVAAIIIILFFIFLRHFFREHDNRKIKKWAIIIMLFLLFILFSIMAKNVAFERANALRNGHGKLVSLSLKKGIPAPYFRGKLTNRPIEIKKMHLIIQTDKSYFVLYQPPGDKNIPQSPIGYVFEIPKDNINWANIELK